MKKQKIVLAAFVVLVALSLKTTKSAGPLKTISYPVPRTSESVYRTKAYYQQNDRYDVLQKKITRQSNKKEKNKNGY